MRPAALRSRRRILRRTESLRSKPECRRKNGGTPHPPPGKTRIEETAGNVRNSHRNPTGQDAAAANGTSTPHHATEQRTGTRGPLDTQPDGSAHKEPTGAKERACPHHGTQTIPPGAPPARESSSTPKPTCPNRDPHSTMSARKSPPARGRASPRRRTVIPAQRRGAGAANAPAPRQARRSHPGRASSRPDGSERLAYSQNPVSRSRRLALFRMVLVLARVFLLTLLAVTLTACFCC